MATIEDKIIAEFKKSLEKTVGPRTYNEKRPETYLSNYGENLFCGELSAVHRRSFDSAKGGELREVNGRPAKMTALRSSSAFAVNLFGDVDTVNIMDNQCGLPVGRYSLNYEEKRGMTVNGHYANIDARLSSCDAEIFVEVKLLEPLSFYPKSNVAYTQPQDYPACLGSDVIDAFVQVFRDYENMYTNRHDYASPKGEKYPPIYSFDACQMFKHLLGILHLSCTGMLKSKKVYLVNCHWRFPAIPDRIGDRYEAALNHYMRSMEKLRKAIMLSGILSDLTVINLDHKEMMATLSMTDAHSRYMSRYDISL